jgi:capsular exopolysaccharide synthesis family protein
MPGRPPSSPLPPALSTAPDFNAFVQGLRRRWISAVLLGGTLAAVSAVATWYLLTPKNVAVAKLHVAALPPTVGGKLGENAPNDFKTFMQTAAGQIMSRPVIAAALRSDAVKRLGLDRLETDPTTYVEEELKVDFKENSELLNISMSSYDPNVAVTVANAIKDAYMEEIYYNQQKAQVARVTELEKAFNEQRESLMRKKNNLTKLAKTLGTTDPLRLQESRIQALQDLREAKHRMVDVGFKLVEAKSTLEAMDMRAKLPVEAAAPVPAPDVEAALEADAQANEYRKRIAQLELIYEDYANKGGANYPTAVATRDRIDSLNKQIEKRRVAVAERLKRNVAIAATGPKGEPASIARAQLDRTITRLNELQASLLTEIKELEEKANNPKTLGPELENAMEDVRCTEKVVDELGLKVEHERVELRAASRINNFQNAELMKKEGKKQLLATIAVPFAVFGGVCGGLAWLDVRQRRIRSAGQVSRGLGIRVVGAVPDRPGLEKQVVTTAGENDLEGTPVLESIDAIRTQLLHEADAHSARLVMVTSAVTGEGKTTLASHLAGSLARSGRKTLLVDGDLRRPSIHQLFEMPQQPGLSEVLLGEVEVAEAWQDTTADNLTVMTAGQWDREVLLALSRGGLEGVLEKLVEEFDFVVIDSHPVLAATDSLLLGRQVDAVILSVLREVSQMPKVYAAAQKMQTLGIRVLGAVVNGTDPEEVFTSTLNSTQQVA